MFKFFLILLLVFLLIRFTFRFLLPVLKITRMTQRSMQELKKKMEQQTDSRPAAGRTPPAGKADGEYIDYEEVK